MQRLLVYAVLFIAVLIPIASMDHTSAGLSQIEVDRIIRHGPWPPPQEPDPSNRLSGQPAAIALGRALFFDARLSADGALSCASCHNPARGWADGQPRSPVRDGRLERNTPSLLDVRFWRWFGWDGGTDSLWAASLAPILAPREMAASPAHVAGLLRADARLAACAARAFGQDPTSTPDETLLVDAAKALAAFQETLISPRSPFDDFRDALARGDTAATAAYPEAARRGAVLFTGRGNCAICHLGAGFTNGEFHSTGVPHFTETGVDGGRHAGIARLRASPYTLLSRWNDDRQQRTAGPTDLLDPQHRNFGEFRTPSLRHVALGGPYGHDGSQPTLRDVLRHYSTLNPERLHEDGEAILRPLDLTEAEMDDLAAFLVSIGRPASPFKPPCQGCCGPGE